MTGPARGRRKRAKLLRALLPCLALIALRRGPGAGPNGHPRSVSPGARRLRLAAGFAAAPDQRQHRRRPPIPPIPMTSFAARTARRRRGSARSRPTAFPPPTAPRAPVSIPSTARARSRNSIPASPSRSRRRSRQPAPAASRRCRFRTAAMRLSIPPSETANKTPLAARDGGHGGRPAAAQAAEGRRRSVRRGRRLRRQLSDQVGGRTLRRLRHQSRPPARCPRDRRSRWSRRNFSPSPTGIATRWSPTCGDRSPAMATPSAADRRRRLARRRPISTGRISPAMSTAVSTSPTTPA